MRLGHFFSQQSEKFFVRGGGYGFEAALFFRRQVYGKSEEVGNLVASFPKFFEVDRQNVWIAFFCPGFQLLPEIEDVVLEDLR